MPLSVVSDPSNNPLVSHSLELLAVQTTHASPSTAALILRCRCYWGASCQPGDVCRQRWVWQVPVGLSLQAGWGWTCIILVSHSPESTDIQFVAQLTHHLCQGYSQHRNSCVWSPTQPGILPFASINGELGRQECIDCSFFGELQCISPCTVLFAPAPWYLHNTLVPKGLWNSLPPEHHSISLVEISFFPWEMDFVFHVPMEGKGMRLLAHLILTKENFLWRRWINYCVPLIPPWQKHSVFQATKLAFYESLLLFHCWHYKLCYQLDR